MAKDRREQVFNDKPGRHFRRTYNPREVRIGAVILIGLAGVGGWVLWKGAHPEAALFAAAPEMVRRGPAPAGAGDRGPLAEGLAPDGWSEQALSRYTPDTVYEKINGRAGFYKSFGLQGMTFVRYADPEDETRSVDIEIYDLGEPVNALGCLSAEAGEGAEPEQRTGGVVLAAPNARFVARGALYLRLVASDASERSVQALDHLVAGFLETLPGGALPWSHTLITALGLPAGSAAYAAEDAFSLAVGLRVHSAELDQDGTALFFSVVGDDAPAAAADYLAGFADFGEETAGADGRTWVKDPYQSRVSTAVAVPPFVAGVYSAADPASGAGILDRLVAALEAMPEDQRALAERDIPALDGGAAAGETEGEDYNE